MNVCKTAAEDQKEKYYTSGLSHLTGIARAAVIVFLVFRCLVQRFYI